MSSRPFVRTVSLAVLAAVAFATSPVRAQDTSLRSLADAADFHFGAAVDVQALDDPGYEALLVDHVNTLSTRSDLSVGVVQPQPGVFDFSAADAIVDFAVANDMAVRGHDLIAGDPLPGWIVEGQWTADTLGQVLHDHVTAVVSHFAERNPGVVTQWDVVADAVLPDGTPRPSIWQQVIGDDYVRIAFDAARAADPTALLYYDDFYDDLSVTQDAVASGVAIVPGANAERSTCELVTKCVAIRDRLSALIGAGAPIDGVGFQSHLFSPDPADFGAFTAFVGELGLRWAVTEFDVPLPVTEITNPDSLAFQAATYAAAVGACAAAPNCDTFVTWGVTDRFSPIDEETGGAFGGALWIDDADQPKPALAAIAEVLADHAAPPPTIAPTTTAPTTTVTPTTVAVAPPIDDPETSSNAWWIGSIGVGAVVVVGIAIAVARRRSS